MLIYFIGIILLSFFDDSELFLIFIILDFLGYFIK